MIKSAMPTVWENIDDELRRLRKNPSWLGVKLKATRQTINGWKNRGVPTARHEEIAAVFGWTVDRLIHGREDAEAAAAQTALDYSPQALHLARIFDEIEDGALKMRVYWKATQLVATGDDPPWSAAPARPTEPATAAPAPRTTTKPHPVK